MYFWTEGLLKTCSDRCLKSPLSENPSTSNMVNRPTQCSKLNDSTFTIFVDPLERSSCSKSFSEWYGKSQDCLLTLSLRIISILLLWKTIYCNIFWSNYLRKKKHLISFFFLFAFLKFRFNFEDFQNKTTLIADVFLNLHTT